MSQASITPDPDRLARNVFILVILAAAAFLAAVLLVTQLAAAQGMGGQGGKYGPGMASECPWMPDADLGVSATVTNTKQGATLALVAKKPEDAAKVQALAQRIAARLAEGGYMHGHGHGHGHGPMNKGTK